MSKSIIVIGASGLLGSGIKNIDNLYKAEMHYPTRVDCDLLDENSVYKYFEKFQNTDFTIINAAAYVGGLLHNQDNNLKYLMLNTQMAINIVNVCLKYRPKRLVNILSTCVFPAKCKLPLKSADIHSGPPHHSNIGYSYSKRFLDISSMLLSDASDIEVINLIPTNLYGYNDNYNIYQGHVIPALLHKFYICEKEYKMTLRIHGDGCDKRQFLFAEDFAKIILEFCMIDIQKKFIQCIVGGKEEEISIRQLVNIIKLITCLNVNIEFSNEESGGQARKMINNSELNKYIPNFKFTDFSVGLNATWEYFIKNYEKIRK